MATLTLTAAALAAARFLGVLDSGETLSTAQLADALEAGNDLLDNWSSEDVMVPSLLISTFNYIANQQAYTIGSGGGFNMARPLAVIAATSIITANAQTIETGIEVLDNKRWSALPDRGDSANFVKYMFYDRANAGGLGKVYFSPRPLGGSVELHTWVPLTQFADATTPITIPPGYFRPFKIAFAFELAPQYDVQPSAALIQNYQDAMARIRNLNASMFGRAPAAGQATAVTTPAGAIQE